MRYRFFVVFVLLVVGAIIMYKDKSVNIKVLQKQTTPLSKPRTQLNPLAIEAMRERTYPGSDITIEQTLEPGNNYTQYIASYMSDGLKIYALLTVPDGTMPKAGWPVILFNHGYIPPEIYRTTERYVAYVAALAQSGYIVFKPDYRGNGNSQGMPEGAYYSPAYAVDDLNALSSVKKLKDPRTGKELIVNPNKIGVWGHSVDPTSFISSITAPIQLDHGLADEEVPVAFSQGLYNDLKAARKTVEFYTYPGADHNIAEPSFDLAMQRTIAFFDKYLK